MPRGSQGLKDVSGHNWRWYKLRALCRFDLIRHQIYKLTRVLRSCSITFSRKRILHSSSFPIKYIKWIYKYIVQLEINLRVKSSINRESLYSFTYIFFCPSFFSPLFQSFSFMACFSHGSQSLSKVVMDWVVLAKIRIDVRIWVPEV